MQRTTGRHEIIAFLRELKPALRQEGIRKIGLFGSFANGRNGVYSDIDIAIEKERDYLDRHSPYEYFETVNRLRSSLMQRFHRNIDIFDLDSTSPLKTTIEKELFLV
jgi:predicted nucleotidyltransferase